MQTHEVLATLVGSRKNRNWVYNNGPSHFVYSKYFFDRPSAQGFKRGLGINLQKGQINFSSGRPDSSSAFKLHDGFENGQKYIVGLDFDGTVPFYFNPWFLIFLNFIGLGHVTLILTLCSIPGENRFGNFSKSLNLKIPKILLF